MSKEEVLKLAMTLSEDDRQALIESLLESLPPHGDEMHPAWEAEVRERLRQYDQGEVQAVSWNEAQKQIFGG